MKKFFLLMFLSLCCFSLNYTVGAENNLVIPEKSSDIIKSTVNLSAEYKESGKTLNSQAYSKVLNNMSWVKPYLREVEKKIKSNWNPPQNNISRRVVASLKIAKDGKLISSEVTQSSGVPAADDAALKAIESAAPFALVPDEFKGEFIPIEFTFDYIIHKSTKSNSSAVINSSFANKINWGPYMREVEKKIKSNWNPPQNNISRRVVASLKIAKDGKLISSEVTQSSGVPAADDAALKAIEKSAPFDPLPEGFKGTSVPIEFTFDYNVLNNNLDGAVNPNWGPYMRDLEQKIKRNWTPPQNKTTKRVITTFTVAKNGKLLNSKITKSSGDSDADKAALEAIEKTFPFRPLPEGFKGTSVPIEFTFDYNVLNSNIGPLGSNKKKLYEGHDE